MRLTDNELVRAVYATPDEFDEMARELAHRLDKALEEIAGLELELEILERNQRGN